MYYPGQITATKTAGGGFPQIGGLVQGVPPRKIASIIGIIATRPRFSPKLQVKRPRGFPPNSKVKYWSVTVGDLNPPAGSGWIWISHGDVLVIAKKKHGQAEPCSSKIHSHSYSALVG